VKAPLPHPQVIQAIESLLDDRNDKELLFKYNSLAPLVKRLQIPYLNKGIFVLGDLRKFTEQYDNIVQWDQSNRAYIMTHGVMGSIEGTLSTRCRKMCKTFI
jgi:hypothetical protein